MEIVRTENLCKIYGQDSNLVRACDNINIKIDRGEFISIIGPSGSGKSTLLHMLGGVDSPTSGKIFIENNDISTYTSKELALFRRRKVGLIYQFYNLIQNLTVRHNIELPLKLDGRKVNEKELMEIVEKLGLKDKLDNFPNTLSGGQQQRVAIARSLIYKPAIILADEPTGNLDRENSKEIMEIFKYYNKILKQTIIIITHDQKLALETKRIINIVDGKVVGDDRNE